MRLDRVRLDRDFGRVGALTSLHVCDRQLKVAEYLEMGRQRRLFFIQVPLQANHDAVSLHAVDEPHDLLLDPRSIFGVELIRGHVHGELQRSKGTQPSERLVISGDGALLRAVAAVEPVDRRDQCSELVEPRRLGRRHVVVTTVIIIISSSSRMAAVVTTLRVEARGMPAGGDLRRDLVQHDATLAEAHEVDWQQRRHVDVMLLQLRPRILHQRHELLHCRTRGRVFGGGAEPVRLDKVVKARVHAKLEAARAHDPDVGVLAKLVGQQLGTVLIRVRSELGIHAA